MPSRELTSWHWERNDILNSVFHALIVLPARSCGEGVDCGTTDIGRQTPLCGPRKSLRKRAAARWKTNVHTRGKRQIPSAFDYTN